MSFGVNPWRQQHWDWRAAANFTLGGAGAGMVVAAALMDGEAARAATAGGLAMVAAGLGAVWLEIGRKLRALHVFFNPFTSWMTRESFAALLVFGFGGASLATGLPALAWAAALAALGFVYCQARILHAAKGIPAWRVPQVVPLVVATGLAEGAGLAAAIEPATAPLAFFALVVLARGFAWPGYRAALPEGRARRAMEVPGRALLQLGTVALLVLLPAIALFPETVWLAALLSLAAGWRFKFALLGPASFNQGFALPRLPVRGARRPG